MIRACDVFPARNVADAAMNDQGESNGESNGENNAGWRGADERARFARGQDRL
jgi:hypothetical protein